MDAETAGTIAQLTDRIDALETSLRIEIRSGFADVRQYGDSRVAGAMSHADVKFAEAKHHTDKRFDELKRHTDEQFATVRREMRVLNENVRGDIGILVEGFATLSIKIDSLLR